MIGTAGGGWLSRFARSRDGDVSNGSARSYGTELWEFDREGLMQKRLASINDAPIQREERRVF